MRCINTNNDMGVKTHVQDKGNVNLRDNIKTPISTIQFIINFIILRSLFYSNTK